MGNVGLSLPVLLALMITGCSKGTPAREAPIPHAALIRKLARIETAVEMGASTERLGQLAEDIQTEAKLEPVPTKAIPCLEDLGFRIELVRLDVLGAPDVLGGAGPRGMRLEGVEPGSSLWYARSNSIAMRS